MCLAPQVFQLVGEGFGVFLAGFWRVFGGFLAVFWRFVGGFLFCRRTDWFCNVCALSLRAEGSGAGAGGYWRGAAAAARPFLARPRRATHRTRNPALAFFFVSSRFAKHAPNNKKKKRATPKAHRDTYDLPKNKRKTYLKENQNRNTTREPTETLFLFVSLFRWTFFFVWPNRIMIFACARVCVCRP